MRRACSPGVHRNDRGVALFAAVAGMVLLSTMIVALVVLARNESTIAQLNKDEAQAAYAAEAGTNWGRQLLAQRLRVELPAAVAATSRNAMKAALVGTYNSLAGAAQFIVDYAVPAAGPAFALCTSVSGGCPEPGYSAVGDIPDAQQAVMTFSCPGAAGCPPNVNFTTRVIVGAHPTTPPVVVSGGNGAVFTYVWRIESSGTAGRARQQWVIHDSSVPTNQAGSFKIALNAEFVKYAHFIDQFQDAGGDNPWISYRHVYTGPVHTNTRFSILGNTAVAGQEGPTFRSEATQTMSTTRFSNGGSAQNLQRDSSPLDWPLLGPDPGILCKQVDCSGFTRSFDFDPTTPGIQAIPFPGGNNPQDRIAQICLALGVSTASCPTSPNPPPSPCSASNVAVVVSNNCSGHGPLEGGIYVNGSVLDLLLAHTNSGQTIVIYTSSTRRTIIEEGQPIAGQTRVTRQCRKTSSGSSSCSSSGSNWYPDPTIASALREQIFDGLLSPDPATDHGIIFVNNGDIGQAGSLRGLRRGTYRSDNTNTNDGVDLSPQWAIYQDPSDDSRGTRLTIAADGNIWITGNLNYRVDPRGADGFFSHPIPGDPTGTSADDELDVQNVLGIVSWARGMDGGVRLSSALTCCGLQTHAMVFAANLSNDDPPSGQFSFDDWEGNYRGISTVLGGVVQKTMGSFGQPSTNRGYERDWIYDERFRYRALSPPAFPGFPNFSAGVDLGIDSYTWRLGLF